MVNWRLYSNALVRRGEVVLDLDVIDNWSKELKDMNDGKKGDPYAYPNSLSY
jgi:hypothetical protein